MTTISIALKDLLNRASLIQISFTLVSAVFTAEGSTIKVGDTVTTRTDDTGSASVSLSAGNYLVQVGSKKWTISVSGTGIANLIDLVAITVPTPIQKGLPSGGSVGQVLGKKSNTDYDAGWLTAVLTDNNFTNALKTAYDSAVSWISTNGTGVVNHVASISNPHNVTKSDIGLGNVQNVNTTTTANITDSTNKRFVLDSQISKLNNISITQAVDLDAIEARVNSLDAAIILRGSWDPTSGVFPGSGIAQAGDSFIVSADGIVWGVSFNANDRIIALTDNASTSVFTSNWFKADYTDQFLSLDGRLGAVTLGDVIANLTAKSTLADADTFVISDSAVSNASKKFSWLNLKNGIKSYYDSLSTTLTNKTIDGANNSLTNIALSSITNLISSLAVKANLSGATFIGAISATNLSNTNTGDETTATIQSKLASVNNVVGGYPTLDYTNHINQSQLPSLRFGWFTEVTSGSGIPDTSTIQGSVQTNLNTTINSTNAYISLGFYTTSVFNASIKPALDANLSLNLFAQADGTATSGAKAQLPRILAGDFDAATSSLVADINSYFVANPSKVGKIEIKICFLHEFNISAYRWGFPYNRTNGGNWSSTAQITAGLGLNSPTDFAPAFTRISNIVMASAARTLGVVKMVVVANHDWGHDQDNIVPLTNYYPARSTYDYLGIDVYDRYGSSSAPYNYSVGFDYSLRKNGNRLYELLVNLSDAPIIITESGSSSNTTKYSKIDKFINAYYDILHNMPQVAEWTYFAPAGSSWVISNAQLQQIAPIFQSRNFRIVEWIKKKFTNKIKSNIILTDTANGSNWSVGGTNAGTKTITTTTTPTSVGSDETDKNSTTIQLSHTLIGTDPFLNYLYFTDSTAGSNYEPNTAHMFSIEANADTDGMWIAIGICNDSTANYANFKGFEFIKISREAKRYGIGINSGVLTGTLRFCICVGHSPVAGNIYINGNSIKFEKGEIESSLVASTTNTLTTNTAQTVTAKKTFGTSTSGATLALTPGTAPTSPANGDIWNDAGDVALNTLFTSMRRKLVTVPRLLATRNTVANTTTQSALYSLALPANVITTDTHLRVEIDGRYSTTGTPTLNLELYVGGVKMTDWGGAIMLPLSVTNQFFIIRFTLQHNGAAGSAEAMSVGGKIELYSASNVMMPYAFWTNGSININTTIANNIEVKAAWGTASASNTIQCRVSTELLY